MLGDHNELLIYLIKCCLNKNLFYLRDSLLHSAILLENIEIVKSLIRYGASIDLQNIEGDFRKFLEFLWNFLIFYKGDTPLHLAYMINNDELIEYFKEELKCNVTIKNNEGCYFLFLVTRADCY